MATCRILIVALTIIARSRSDEAIYALRTDCRALRARNDM